MRKNIDLAIAANDAALAMALMAELWSVHAGLATAPLVLSWFNKLQSMGEGLDAKTLRLTVLRSFSVEPAVPLLKAAAMLGGVQLDVTLGDFNTYAQDLLSPDGPAYEVGTDAVILAVQTRDIAPDIWLGQGPLDEARVAAVIAEFAGLIDAFRSRSDAALVVHNLEQPAWPADGVLDGQSTGSQRDTIFRINAGIVQAATQHTGVYVLDYDGLVSRHGRACWSDEARWLTMRLPVAMENLHHLADEWLKHLVPISGKIAKALIVDLDNTLWGGVLGEDGPDGIELDGEYPGAAFQAVQRVLLDLSRRGIILGVCSKNDEGDALTVLRDHPGMLVRPDDFAVFKINWQDKATNIKAIAQELNIGTDAIAFLDDNAAERLWVRQSLPEVHVIEVSDDPLGYADALRAAPVFERLSVSSEDRQRKQHYADQRARQDLQGTVASLEDFYQSLDMHLDVFVVGASDIQRVAQLTQKTNQFNLTTRRYSEADIAKFVEDPAYMVYAARATDRFGDSGIIAVAMIAIADNHARLDTFLMSCRVIGRTVETAMLAVLARKLEDAGIKTLVGEFIPTPKNAPASEFLANHGFGEDQTLNLPAPSLQVPGWIKT